MPWIVGIDEAGYGPNLGPFVMTSVACRVPDDLAGADLWHILRAAVRRHPSQEDGRLLVEDSKVVYSTTRGLHALETGVLGTLFSGHFREPLTLAAYVDHLCPAHRPDLAGECWYTGASALPVAAQPEEFEGAADRFEETCKASQVAWGLVRSVVVCPPRFNQVLDRWGSKGAVLGNSLAQLLQCNRDPVSDAEPVLFFVDKHGGRNNYALVQDAIADGAVVALEEGMARSVYRVLGLPREVRLTFQPRADAEHFCVALASMVSKYLREVLMAEFNAFWQVQVPGLKATAGYPGDATRFYTAIRPAMTRLGLGDEAVWRRK